MSQTKVESDMSSNQPTAFDYVTLFFTILFLYIYIYLVCTPLLQAQPTGGQLREISVPPSRQRRSDASRTARLAY